jgi:hypothetical protein
MPHTSVTQRVDAFAYYLPQFYPAELNSRAWGDGYTEWHAVVKSQRGDRSPSGTTLTPGELGFYDLRSIETRRRQAELAHISGIAAFCIYHYYSAGERVIPEVVDAILNDGEPDFPFFFCWANHDWTLAWQGHPEVITLKQEYDEDNVDDHFSWLLQSFGDERYFKIGNAPVIAIYDPEAIPSSLEVLNHWRKLTRQAGYSGLVILGVAHVISPRSGSDVGVDSWIQAAGATLATMSTWRRILPELKTPGRIWRFLRYRDYHLANHRLSALLRRSRRDSNTPLIPLVISAWNNVGRRSRRAWYFEPDPEVFEASLRDACADAPVVYSPDGRRKLVAINAWNEWGENMTLEPSHEQGDAMLKAAARALGECKHAPTHPIEDTRVDGSKGLAVPSATDC